MSSLGGYGYGCSDSCHRPIARASGEEGCKHLADGVYSSEPVRVEKCSGPNENVNTNIADNNSGVGVCDAIWEYSGGSYTQIIRTCNDELKEISVELPAPYCRVYGHGTAARPYNEYEYILIGEQFGEGCA